MASIPEWLAIPVNHVLSELSTMTHLSWVALHGMVHSITMNTSPFTTMQGTSWEMLGWINYKLKSRLLGEISTTSDNADDTTLRAESKKELKSLYLKMRVKEESERAGLKLNIQKTKMASDPITSWQIDGETMETVRDFIFWGSRITADGDCSREIKRCLLLGRKAMNNLDSILKSRDITLPTKVRLDNGVSSSHVWTWELDHKESWVLKNWCFWTMVLEKTLEGSLDCKIKAVNPKRYQPWIFTEWTDVEAEAPILWLLDVKSQLTGKESEAGKDWG